MNSGSRSLPRRANSRRAASANTRSESISVPSRSQTAAPTIDRSTLFVIGIYVGKLIVFDGDGRNLAGAVVGLSGRLFVEQRLHVAGIHLHCKFSGRRRRLAGPEVHPESQTRHAQLIVWEKCRPAHALTVDPRAVRAAQIANQQQSVGFHDDAVLLGDALMVEAHVAILLPADHGQVFDQVHRRTAVHGNELRAHGRDHDAGACARFFIITVNFAAEYGQGKAARTDAGNDFPAANPLPRAIAWTSVN